MKPRSASWQLKLTPPIVLAVIALACVISGSAQKPTTAPGVQIISVQGYPELRVDGRPFFVHAAEFSYYRIPKDLWSRSLDRFRELGINTIDLRIPWNWHEIREGEFDFDGHTNPRRDLRGLLQTISEKGFYLIARPGPESSDEWKNDGLPDRRFTPNNVLAYSPAWLAAVAHELAPYSSAKSESAPEARSSGRLLFMILNGGPSIDAVAASNQAPQQSESAVRDSLTQAGLDSRFLAIEPHSETGVNDEPRIPAAGEWFMSQTGHTAIIDPKAGGARVTDDDAQTLAFIAQNLRVQTDFPAMLASFQAGWPTPPDDTAPPRSSSSNTLLATRRLMAQGVTGIEYSPLQDSLTPPGFQTAAANRDFRWNAALNLNGEKQEHAQAVTRNGKFLELWGEFLASSHPRAGIGLIDWSSGLAKAERISREQEADAVRKSLPMFQRIERVALLAGLPVSLVSLEKQSTELLLHNSFLLLAIPDSLRGKPFLPPPSQNSILEYVRAGGVLICNPERPTGDAFDQAMTGAESRAAGDGFRVTKLGRGRIVEWSKDFYSWLDPTETFAQNFQQQESHFAISALQSAAQLANLRAPIVQSNENQATFLVSELVSNAAAGMLAGQQSDCESHPACTTGLLSVTNWSGAEEIQQTLKFLPPNSDPRAASDSDYIEIPVDVPARESLMLPLNFPLCSRDAPANNCPDRIVAAGAELLAATREGKAIQLTLYAPTAATVVLHVRAAPVSADLPVISPSPPRVGPFRPSSRPRGALDTNEGPPLGPTGEPVLAIGDPSFPERILHGTYEKNSGIFKVIVPRGAAPNFQRVLRVHLSYDPDLPEQKKPVKQRGHGYRFSVADAIRFPLNDGKSLVSDPPIVLLDKDRNGQFLIEAQNLDDTTIALQASVSGAAQGSASLHMSDQESDIQTLKLRANGSTESGSDGLLTGTLTVSGGHIPDRSSPIRFLIADSDTPVHYQYDFERSGSRNWVLENKRTRFIFLPAAGGQISALVDKLSGTNLTTMSGGLRDLVRVRAAAGTPDRLVDPMLNVQYDAEWSASADNTAIQMKAQWPKGAPITGGITKTVRVSAKDGTDIIEAEYLLHGENKNSSSVVSAFSVPASAEKSEGTQFCWTARAAQTSPDAAPAAGAAPEHCSPFVAGGNDFEIPTDAARIEIRTPGRPTLAMEWDSGHISIEQKQHSARIVLEFPALTSQSGAEGVRDVVRYIVVRAP